jgi:hypothetical protein
LLELNRTPADLPSRPSATSSPPIDAQRSSLPGLRPTSSGRSRYLFASLDSRAIEVSQRRPCRQQSTLAITCLPSPTPSGAAAIVLGQLCLQQSKADLIVCATNSRSHRLPVADCNKPPFVSVVAGAALSRARTLRARSSSLHAAPGPFCSVAQAPAGRLDRIRPAGYERARLSHALAPKPLKVISLR